MTISATMVKDLREKTGAGMMDCKAALTETKGDIEAAVDWLRAKGLSKAAKKAGRVAAEGLIAVASSASGRSWSRSTRRPISSPAIPSSRRSPPASRRRRWRPTERSPAILAAKMPDRRGRRGRDQGGDRDHRREHVAPPGGDRSASARASVASYVHSAVAPGLGKIGVIVGLEFDRQRGASSPRSASRWRCTSPPPIRSPSAPRNSTRRRPARAGDLRRAGAGVRQARGDHREDGRGPRAQVLRGSRAPVAGLRRRHREDGREARSRRRKPTPARRSR